MCKKFNHTAYWVISVVWICLVIFWTSATFAQIIVQNGTISGTVQDTNGNPIVNLQVFATDYTTNAWMSGANTDSNGNYTIAGLPTGSYRVRACASCDALPYVDEFYSNPVEVTEPNNTPNINFILETGGTISGTVLDTAGNPISNLSINVNEYVTNQWTAGTNTDANGSYSLRVPTGTYRVRACASCDALPYVDEFYSNPVEVTEPNNTPNINFILETGGTITGMVQDTEGNPITNLQVFATDYTTNDWIAGTNTSADGSYSLRLPAGSYRVRACAECSGVTYQDAFYHDVFDYGDATPVEVVKLQNTPQIDFTLNAVATISGTVYQADGMTPITGIKFGIEALQGEPCGERQQVAHAETDPVNGAYTIKVPAGANYLRTSHIQSGTQIPYLNEWWAVSGSSTACNQAELLTLNGGETREATNFQLNADVPVEGGFDLADGVVFVQSKTIVIDGNYADWEETDRVYVDTNGPECNNVSGRDIKALYVAQDAEYIYLRYVLNGTLDDTFGYKLVGGQGDQKHLYVSQDVAGNGYMFYAIPPSDGNPSWSSENLPADFVHVDGNQFECKILKTDVQEIWRDKPLYAWLDQGYETACSDHVQLPTMNLFSSEEISAYAPSAVRPARKYTLWLEQVNVTETEITIPDFTIFNDSNAPMSLTKDGIFQTGLLRILGTGTLAPGQVLRTPLYFEVPGDLPSHHIIHFTVEKVIDEETGETMLAATAESEVIRPDDPNAKAAPAGVGDQHYVFAGDKLSYTIFFENVATASAPAQEVFITDVLDSGLDWNTFSLGDVAFGDQLVNALAGNQSGTTRVILNANLAVDIIVAFDTTNGVVRWTLRTIDRATGEVPEDATVGFLPPNDTNGRGEGYVTFTIRTRNDLVAGTVVPNVATIVFDTEAAIATNEVFNTIGTPIPGVPFNPGISDGAADVLVSTMLSWAASEYATSYDLYLWDLLDQQRPDLPIALDLETASYEPLVDLKYDTTYFWQVVAKNVMGETIGLMWSFTTEANPDKPPIPEPTTLFLIGTGLIGIFALARKKRQ